MRIGPRTCPAAKTTVSAAIPEDQAWTGKDRRPMAVTVGGTAKKEPPKSTVEAKATEADINGNNAPTLTTASTAPKALPPRKRSIRLPQRNTETIAAIPNTDQNSEVSSAPPPRCASNATAKVMYDI